MTDYFGKPACLAQSPQLYKQMTAACGGFERVMEVTVVTAPLLIPGRGAFAVAHSPDTHRKRRPELFLAGWS